MHGDVMLLNKMPNC